MKRDFIRWQVLMERDLDQRVRLLLLAKRISLSEYVRRLVEADLNGGERRGDGNSSSERADS